MTQKQSSLTSHVGHVSETKGHVYCGSWRNSIYTNFKHRKYVCYSIYSLYLGYSQITFYFPSISTLEIWAHFVVRGNGHCKHGKIAPVPIPSSPLPLSG